MTIKHENQAEKETFTPLNPTDVFVVPHKNLPPSEDQNNTEEYQRGYLQRAFERLLWVLYLFGTVSSWSSRRSKENHRIWTTIRLTTVVLLIVLFILQLAFMYLQAVAEIPTTTVMKVHFLTRSQFTAMTALSIAVFSTRTTPLRALLASIVKACVWSEPSEFSLVRRIILLHLSVIGLGAAVLSGQLIAKAFVVRGLTDSFFGLSIPAELLSITSDLALVTSLISYFISDSQLEAPIGHFITQNATDTAIYFSCAIGTEFMLTTGIVLAAYLNHQADSCIPELYRIIEDLDVSIDLDGHIERSLRRLRDTPVALTGLGLFLMNKSFILTVIGVGTTYLVVMVQINVKNGCNFEHVTWTHTSPVTPLPGTGG
ncbi:hypothetical protein BV898_17591 [Hypsibius exemplaris]|uniref:Gustatory receptor n=1 Tax=Hypsibius exemplaris TaxID=2072580 RepID=A0A9X6NFD0_HYPEX|nr:hypothetical protein BV898_17591 [Hypsibius exemplaris]